MKGQDCSVWRILQKGKSESSRTSWAAMSMVQTRHEGYDEGYAVQGGGRKGVEKFLDLEYVFKLKSVGLAITCQRKRRIKYEQEILELGNLHLEEVEDQTDTMKQIS